MNFTIHFDTMDCKEPSAECEAGPHPVACGAFSFSSAKNPDRVTCGNCRRTVAWDEAKKLEDKLRAEAAADMARDRFGQPHHGH